MYEGLDLGRTVNGIFLFMLCVLVLSVPLGIWKMVDIIIWLCRHISMVCNLKEYGMHISIMSIRHRNMVYEFKRPLDVLVLERKSGFIAICQELEVYELGKTFEELWENLGCTINFIYFNYAKNSTHALTEDTANWIYADSRVEGLSSGAHNLQNKLLELITLYFIDNSVVK